MFAVAAWFSIAGVAQAARRFENWVLEGGGCYSPEWGDNTCHVCDTLQCIGTPTRVCAGECGTIGGRKIVSKWVAYIQ
ncbi:hypothetical protein SCE1572_36330 [Sorangium cellulosum So0157-2]|uniref:Uncharacterized protein n=1 Tax=Sorangium cellulosum So0157-2 TaxID=1254432 RepID=S4Y3Y0_SORCE|nr:hypothetical protein SCE1572_36330 [Sorangium cellulosum So0157-2]